MNPDPLKLRQEQREVSRSEETQTQSTALEFATVEELIRYDQERTAVPPIVAERLAESVAREPRPTRSWWRRLFS
jgi:hypothetical protein